MENQVVHVVFGEGQLGSHLSESLLRSGTTVRVAKRSNSGIPDGAEAPLDDATDLSFYRQTVADAEVVYHCMNPAYSARAWEKALPKWQENLITSAGSVGARLVVLENLYMVGLGGGSPINEDTPVRQWESPFEVDDAPFRAEFAVTATDPDERAAATVDWAKSNSAATLSRRLGATSLTDSMSFGYLQGDGDE